MQGRNTTTWAPGHSARWHRLRRSPSKCSCHQRQEVQDTAPGCLVERPCMSGRSMLPDRCTRDRTKIHLIAPTTTAQAHASQTSQRALSAKKFLHRRTPASMLRPTLVPEKVADTAEESMPRYEPGRVDVGQIIIGMMLLWSTLTVSISSSTKA